MAEWKTIKDFPDYRISDDGQVKSLKHGKEKNIAIVQCSKSDKHLKVTLWKDNKMYNRSIHRLLAEAFIPNPENKPYVRHLNDIPSDNRLENLAWGTEKENVEDAKRNGKRINCGVKQRKPIVAIKGNDVKVFESRHEASRELNIQLPHISSCANGNRKTAGGYEFRNAKPRHIGKG